MAACAGLAATVPAAPGLTGGRRAQGPLVVLQRARAIPCADADRPRPRQRLGRRLRGACRVAQGPPPGRQARRGGLPGACGLAGGALGVERRTWPEPQQGLLLVGSHLEGGGPRWRRARPPGVAALEMGHGPRGEMWQGEGGRAAPRPFTVECLAWRPPRAGSLALVEEHSPPERTFSTAGHSHEPFRGASLSKGADLRVQTGGGTMGAKLPPPHGGSQERWPRRRRSLHYYGLAGPKGLPPLARVLQEAAGASGL